MKKKFTLLLLSIVCLAHCGLCLASPEGDTITQPLSIVGTRFDQDGNVVAQHNMEFQYNLDGTLKEMNFPYHEKTRYAYLGDSIYWEQTFNYCFQYQGEDYYWYYDKDGKLYRMKHVWDEDYWVNQYNRYTYDEWGRLVRRDLDNYSWNSTTSHWEWEYSEDGRVVTENYHYGNNPQSRYTYIYDDIHTLLSKQYDRYYSNGPVPRTLTTYTYAPNGKVETEVTQNFNDGLWENASIVEYSYDDKDRITEIRKGPWSQEDQDWNITRRRVFEYRDEDLRMTVTFLRLADGQWTWDDYTKEDVIFFDPPMKTVHQRQMRFINDYFYYHYNDINYFDPVNQLEVTYTLTGIPNYTDVAQCAKSDVAVYPNPGKEEVTVKAPVERAVVRFYDSQGRLVVSKPFDFSTTVTTAGWAPGVYVYEVWHDTAREASGKWIKK